MNTATREANRLKVQTDRTAVEKALAEANEGLKHLIEARKLAKRITGKDVTGITGTNEVADALKHKDFPNAPLSTLANLHGVSNEYKRYLDEVALSGDIGRFEVKGGEVQIAKRYRDQVEDEATLFLEGNKREAYLALDELCKEYNRTKEDLGTRIEKYIRVDHTGTASVNLPMFLMGFSGR